MKKRFKLLIMLALIINFTYVYVSVTELIVLRLSLILPALLEAIFVFVAFPLAIATSRFIFTHWDPAA